MDNKDLLTIISGHRKNAIGGAGSSDVANMKEAIDRYHGRPYGDEVDGKSSVVSKGLSQTLDWYMPVVMEAFIAGGEIVEFSPTGKDDIEAAAEASAYMNHVIMKDNDGFTLLFDAIHDAFLLRNGYWKHFWEDDVTTVEREWKNITINGLTKLFTDLEAEHAEIKILNQEENDDGNFNIRLKIKRSKQRVKIFAIPKEEVRVSRECKGNINTSPYVEHETTKKRYELLQMGMDKKFVEDLAATNAGYSTGTVTSQSRSVNRDGDPDGSQSSASSVVDRSTDSIAYSEVYLMVDYDGTGEAQLRAVTIVGGKIPKGDKWNQVIDSIPITGVVTKRMPHRHTGVSLHDDLASLERLTCVLYRQLLDNTYATTNIESVVNNRVHTPDLGVSLPGGSIRIDDDRPVQEAYMPVPVQSIIDKILPTIDYFEKVKGQRTGANDTAKAQDPDVIKKSTKGAFIESLDRSSTIVRMAIRTIAELGVKELVLRVHQIVISNQDINRQVKLNGKFTEVDPRQWIDRTDLTINVGLGTGTKEEKRQNLMILAGMQERLIEMGLVDEAKAYKLYEDMAKTLGVLDGSKYAVAPDENNPEYTKVLQKQKEAAESQTNPLAEAEKVKGQMQLEITKLQEEQKGALERLKQEYNAQLSLFKQQSTSKDKERDRQHKIGLEQIRIDSKEAIAAVTLEVNALIEGVKLDVGKPGIGSELSD